MKSRMFIGWAVGSFTSAALVGAVGLLHLRFMTDSLGIAVGIAGMLVVASRVYDAILDPLMGYFSDHTTTRWGSYRPYLAAGSVLAGLSLILLFNVPLSFSTTANAVFSGLVLLLYSTAYTMYRIPYLALGRAITQDFASRSRLMTFSVCGASLGTLTATSLAPLLLAHFGSDRAAHAHLSWLLALFVVAGGIATFLLIDQEGERSETQAHAFSIATAVSAIAANRPFRGLIGFKVFMFAGLAVHGAAIPFYTRHVLHASDLSLSSIFLMQTLAMMASQPMWVKVAGKFGRRKGLIAAALGEVAVMLCWFAVPAAHPSPWIQIVSALEGVGAGGLMFGLYTVLTDIMDETRTRAAATGTASQEGLLAGVFVMVEKATAAIGGFLFSMVLAWAGFVSAVDAGAAQPPAVTAGIAFALAILPAGLALCACFLLRERGGRTGTAAAVAAVASVVLAGTWLGHSGPALAAPKATATTLTIKRIVDGPGGKSRVEDYVLPRAPGVDPAATVARLYATDVEVGTSPPGMFIDWHRVSTPRLLVILKGTMEIGTGDGKLHRLGPGDFALAMDTTGQGHTSRTVGKVPVTAMTVRLPKDDPLRSRDSSCSDGISGAACVANGITIKHQ